ncbi:hypothetical protein Dimus_031428, partial [Dionaea muscipula]
LVRSVVGSTGRTPVHPGVGCDTACWDALPDVGAPSSFVRVASQSPLGSPVIVTDPEPAALPLTASGDLPAEVDSAGASVPPLLPGTSPTRVSVRGRIPIFAQGRFPIVVLVESSMFMSVGRAHTNPVGVCCPYCPSTSMKMTSSPPYRPLLKKSNSPRNPLTLFLSTYHCPLIYLALIALR